MSKQTGEFPEVKERKPTAHKKQKGKFELWMRFNPDFIRKDYGLSFLKRSCDWHCVRKYKTMELAKENLEASRRKWNTDRWEFEIRVKDDK